MFSNSVIQIIKIFIHSVINSNCSEHGNENTTLDKRILDQPIESTNTSNWINVIKGFVKVSNEYEYCNMWDIQ